MTVSGQIGLDPRVPRLDTRIKVLESAAADPGPLFEHIAWHIPMFFDEEGRFGIDGPVDLRRQGPAGRYRP